METRKGIKLSLKACLVNCQASPLRFEKTPDDAVKILLCYFVECVLIESKRWKRRLCEEETRPLYSYRADWETGGRDNKNID